MALTPMMQQYLETKKQVGDALLLFRMGDFYELFFEDAAEAHRLLGITLTSRDKGNDPIPMAGFPYHALDNYMAKLLEVGQRVAICEQVEDPRTAVGLVKREITRIVTPGTVTDPELLDPRRNNFLLALHLAPRGKKVGLAWLDLSTSRVFLHVVEDGAVSEEVGRLEPAECLIADDRPLPPHWMPPTCLPMMTPRPAFTFHRDNALDLLCKHFQVATFTGYGLDHESPALLAAGGLFAYLYETQRTDLKHIAQLVPVARSKVMVLDPITRRSLEIARSLRENRREGTLLDTIDRTVTPGGARCLAEWIGQPLLDIAAIHYRQAAVAEWKEEAATRHDLRSLLAQTHDVERLAARVSTQRTNPRDLASVRQTLRALPAIKARLAGRLAPANADLEEALDLLPELRDDLEQVLVEEPPLLVREGGIVRGGYNAELDELREIAQGGRLWMANYQATEATRCGIPNLKVGFNKVFGYYVEIPNSGRTRVPDSYERKQTVKNAERYITPELKEYERKVLGAEERANDLEYDIFCQTRDKVSACTDKLFQIASALARLDCVLGMAELAATRHYARPTIVETGELHIDGGRHPVLDSLLPAGHFVPNDVHLDGGEGRFWLITGPNMAGKSVFIRQVALITLLAQVGSFVPASSATIGLVDRIFTRVGASDELSRGQSTFMVEMAETANILNNATERSLVILDEIGRGTSTYDGISLAWAISEYLHDRVNCRTLFATHYHELIELEKRLENLRNRNVAVREWQDEIVFLHQIVAGGADRSYGIHVARLAGVPKDVLRRAQQILEQLERDPFGNHAGDRIDRPRKHRRTYHQLSLFPNTTSHPILDDLRLLELDNLTPEVALNQLRRWQRDLLAEP